MGKSDKETANIEVQNSNLNSRTLISAFEEELNTFSELESDQFREAIRSWAVRFLYELTRTEAILFTTSFARLAYLADCFEIDPLTQRWICELIAPPTLFAKSGGLLNKDVALCADKLCAACKSLVEALKKGISNKPLANSNYFNPHLCDTTFAKIRVTTQRIDADKQLVFARSLHQECPLLVFRYHIEGLNERFTPTIAGLWHGAQLNLLHCRFDGEGIAMPQTIVLEPDYLIDASAMAECFQNYGHSHLHYFRRKFEPAPNSKYILLGLLANYFLDEIIYAQQPESLSFEQVFKNSFSRLSFEYCTCSELLDNNAFRAFMDEAKLQFENIKRVVCNDLKTNRIERQSCILEPSFFSETYGFQGRLDLLDSADRNSGGLTHIIELKSGKPPYPYHDIRKIAISHEVQTAIYKLLQKSAFNLDETAIKAYILYSSSQSQNHFLRKFDKGAAFEQDIIALRNRVVAMEQSLYSGTPEQIGQLFKAMFDSAHYGQIPAFFGERLNQLKRTYLSLSPLEEAYFLRFVKFVSEELYLQKAGDYNGNQSFSLSGLWNSDFEERKKALELIDCLTIERIDTTRSELRIEFKRDPSSMCANFRQGDICILYPRERSTDTILSNEILKGTILSLSNQNICVRLKFKQHNTQLFSQRTRWVLEHDKQDSNLNSLFVGLFELLSAPHETRSRILGTTRPSSTPDRQLCPTAQQAPTPKDTISHKTDAVLTKALRANDYFLLVGPPGTGKTSIFIKRLIQELAADPTANILVCAYTNRAVDELCSAICSAFGESPEQCKRYVRIGNRESCNEAFGHNLLQQWSETVKSRKEMLDLLAEKRIFVGTLAAFTARKALFETKKFNIAIIDEASQILEPQLCGFLTRFDKYILIGDHKQLSTITLQDAQHSKIENEQLHSIELRDCRESYFERMYRLCQLRGWDEAFDTLVYHGRMHKEIAAFPNRYFYDGQLLEATERQTAPLSLKTAETDSLTAKLSKHRIVFIAANRGESGFEKFNNDEADKAVAAACRVLSLYHENQIPFDSETTLGIIASYRNQIALIRQKLEACGYEELRHITVDTVERFQGSQRQVIIVSFCFNSSYQLQLFAQTNENNTVDKKLNVALTRAREQLILIGNENILSTHPLYRELLQFKH